MNIQGSAHGQVAESDGLILLSGETDWAFGGVPGRVAVGFGSVLTGYGHDRGVVRPDGTVGSVPSGSININAAGAEGYCYFDRDEGRFIPIFRSSVPKTDTSRRIRPWVERRTGGVEPRSRHHSLIEENSVTHTAGAVGGDSSRPWQTLVSGFEQARAREDSLDRLVEWPAQRAFLGDVTGLAVLDAGCGNGAKIAQLAGEGAGASVGVDISGNFITPPPGVELVEGDLSDLAAVPGLAGRRFDRIPFLQSFGYAADGGQGPAHRERGVDRRRLHPAHPDSADPVRDRASGANGTSLGEEYFATESFAYRHHNWNDQVTLTKRPYTMSDLFETPRRVRNPGYTRVSGLAGASQWIPPYRSVDARFQHSRSCSCCSGRWAYARRRVNPPPITPLDRPQVSRRHRRRGWP